MSELITGRNSVKEALLSTNKTINKILLSRQAHGSIIKEIIDLAKEKKIPIHHVPPERLDVLKEQNNQGVVAEISPTEYLDLESLLKKIDSVKQKTVVLLDNIEDPHNLGAIIRNAVAFGAAGVIFGKWRSASLTDTVSRTSAGAYQHIPLARVSNISDTIIKLQAAGFQVIGAENGATPIQKTVFTFPLALIIGSEAEGLRRLTKERCDQVVSIPQTNAISSINASCASAILLYEIYKKAQLDNK